MFRSAVIRSSRLTSRTLNQVKYSRSIQTSTHISNQYSKKALLGIALSIIGTTGILSQLSNKLSNDDSKTSLYPESSTTPLNDLKPPQYGSIEDFQKAKEEILKIVSEDNIATSKSELDSHSDTYFNSHHAHEDQRPHLIVFPSSTEQVSEILKITHKYKIPIIPFSGGTSLEGHYIATTGTPSITLDLSKNMGNIIALHKEDLDVVVQPGVGWEDLHEFLGEEGLLFGPDPGPGALIGGMISTSCSGTNAARYGTMKENVAGLTVVLADGTIIKTKNRPRKSSAGYNLTGLIIGSEGTLGIVTEATLKLHVKPKEETVAVVSFDKISDASNTVADIVQMGIQVNAVELLDGKMMKVVNDSGETTRTWIESPTLFFKIGANNNNVLKELINEVNEISTKNKSSNFEFAKNKDEIDELWSARKMALWSTINQGRQQDPNMQIWTTDVAVPISKLGKVLEETQQDMEQSGLTATLVGHAGDGNFHAFLLYKPEQRSIAEKLVSNMVQRAIKAEGTCTGEHGVGYGKRDFLLEELGEEPVNMMRRIKISLDPLRLLNPDKIFKIDPNDKEH
ncbi:D-lactate dehydrogenase [cytochrome],mitochondrial [Wickerhamomyces ciferrii]|uniref:D-lactate dehydrogenase (cytochrome) n=1 Tax=Wickerhamomyces ciferrii (strain ATCC 14091 / BCRC 22168 / CBS 111 / JCM 3599 / NBRC 0793 / NRRL Y-1031 F-60-10) TaxID=1206466 RepID=K0KS87_WICCF|nr:D-lactate dehydrogenase [cytochrome],mitochondrial [Wickerhamomyces ciferrii]CCH44203.1 D-lactate dehydrogenase [cytochrome],mitochondrial [Wickerhamomyces ciferrii]